MQTGFVGLGAMGAHMARNLNRAGLLTGVWNRTPGKAEDLAAELRCIAFSSLTELAGNCEAAVICVSADPDLREVICVGPKLAGSHDFQTAVDAGIPQPPVAMGLQRTGVTRSSDLPCLTMASPGIN